MIRRELFTPDGDNPPIAVPLNDICTVPTTEMAYLFADLCGDAEHVLELGTGSGFNTAVLAERCKSVTSVDIEGQPGLDKKLPAHVALVIANGYEYDTCEEWDAVVVTFGTTAIAEVWKDQVKDGGLLILPLQLETGNCQLQVYQRHGDELFLKDGILYAPFTPGAEA